MAGDLLLLAFLIDATGLTLSASGWNAIRSDTDAAKPTTVYLYWRIEDGSALGSLTWGGSSYYNAGVVLAYRGVRAADPIAAHNGQANAASANVDAPGISPPEPLCMGVYIGSDDYGQAVTAPSGWTDRKPFAYDAQPSEKLLYASSATGTVTGTHTSNKSIGQLVALRPESRGPAGPFAIPDDSGVSLATNASSWVAGSWVDVLVEGYSGDMALIGMTAQPTYKPGLDTTTEVLFEVGIGSGPTVVAQFPYSYRKDTAVGYFPGMPCPEYFLPEPMIIPMLTRVRARASNSAAAANTYDGFKLLVRDVNARYSLVTGAQAAAQQAASW